VLQESWGAYIKHNIVFVSDPLFHEQLTLLVHVMAAASASELLACMSTLQRRKLEEGTAQ